MIAHVDLADYLTYLSNLKTFDKSMTWVFDQASNRILTPPMNEVEIDPEPYLFSQEPIPKGVLHYDSQPRHKSTDVRPIAGVSDLFRISFVKCNSMQCRKNFLCSWLKQYLHMNMSCGRKKALELWESVDAFFIAQYSGLKDKNGRYVSTEEVSEWYLTHISVPPEAAVQGQFVKQGMLCSADDSGYKQGYEAAVMAHDFLANDVNPAHYTSRAPLIGK